MTDNVTPEQAQPYREAVNEATRIGKILKNRGFHEDLVQKEMFKHLNKAVSKLKKAPDVLIGTTDSQTDTPLSPAQLPQEQE